MGDSPVIDGLESHRSRRTKDPERSSLVGTGSLSGRSKTARSFTLLNLHFHALDLDKCKTITLFISAVSTIIMSSSSSSTSRSITRAIIALSIISCASPLHHNLNNAVTTETRNLNNVHSNSEQSSSILRRRSTQQSERYYATWNPSQLCGMKSNFDAWEESYESLEECCEMKFAWDYDACIGK